jgi:broad specificity phosphatase PhoE
VPLLLVRHAHAYARKEWSGDDRSRPLSENGLRQAEGLIAVFGNFARPSRVLSSPYLRCVQTMVPLAQANHAEVEPDEELAEGQSSSAIRLVRDLATDNVAVCTHGDVIAEILVALADEDMLDLGPNPRQAKGSVWALNAEDGIFTSARYFPPVVVESV